MAIHNLRLTNDQVDDYLRSKYPLRVNDSLDSSYIPFVTASGEPKRIPFSDFCEILSGEFELERKGITPAYQQTVPEGAKSVIINSIGGKTEQTGNTISNTTPVSFQTLDRNGAPLGLFTLPSDLRTNFGGLRSVGGATYDEYDFSNRKYIIRVTYASLAGLAWAWNSPGQYYEAAVSQKAFGWNNILAPTYSLPASDASADFVDRTIKGFPNNNKIAIKDSRYSTVAALIEALGNSVIYYGMLYRAEMDISPYISSAIILPVEAGGKVLFRQIGTETKSLPNNIVFSAKPAPD